LVKYSNRRKRVQVSFDGEGIASHAGAMLLVELADRAGLTDGLSEAMRGARKRRSRHDPGEVLRDVAVMLADGGDCVSDLAVLQGQQSLFGEVASISTAWRVVQQTTGDQLARLRTASARARAHLWSTGAGPVGNGLTLDFDATIVEAHSEKEEATGTWKHTFGFHPLVCYLDETGEPLAGMLRPGRAGSDTSADHIEVLDQALAQIPQQTGRDWSILARADAGGATHAFANALRERHVRFSLGYIVKDAVREAIRAVSETHWVVALTQDGGEDEDALVCELTASLNLSTWPEGTRAICRREHRHPGAQATLPGLEDYRFVVFITDQPEEDIRLLELQHRRRAHVEDGIRCAKNLGLRSFPSWSFAFNQAWLELLLTAQRLLIWFQGVGLTGPARWWEPKRLRYRLLHISGHIVRSGRRTTLRLQRNWPWCRDLERAVSAIRLLPAAP
jgi:hypothetical protein